MQLATPPHPGHLSKRSAALREHGQSARGLYLLGLIRDAAGQLDAATALYRKVLYLEPAHQDALAHLSLLLEKKGQAGAARLLRERLLRLAGWQSAPEGVFMARERHVAALREVHVQLAAGQEQLNASRPALDLLAEDLRQAQLHLSAITGAFSADDLLGEIFSRFCIGK